MKNISLALIVCLLPGGFAAACGSGGNNTGDPDATTDAYPDSETILPPECVDLDGDGYGPGCDEGGDCDDFDPDHWSDCEDCGVDHSEGCECDAGESYFCYEGPSGTVDVGVCQRGLRSCVDGRLGPCAGQVLPSAMEDCEDGLDNNCNGEADESWLCGDCVAPCYTEGEVEPAPSDPGSSGLIPNPDGPGVILGSSEEEGGFAWIANASEGTVSKLDVGTGAEVGRFRVGLTGTGADSPSRTAVDDYQNAYVAMRAFGGQGSVSKIAGFERYCEDRNGNGVIDTSHGPTPMDLNTDECVLWTAPVGGVDGVPRALVIDFGTIETRGGSPWVGLFNEMRFYKLDPDNGTTLETVDINVNSYGAAIDGDGWIWISGRGNHAIQRFHYSTLEVEPYISISSACGAGEPYGIGIDMADRVWVGMLTGSGACRYNPDDGSWFLVNLGGSGRGISVDPDNVMWVTNYDTFQLHRFNADDGTGLATYNLTGSPPAVGVGVDRLGKIWALDQGSNSIDRFDPGTGTFDFPGGFPVGGGPYTYSDFLGFQRWLMMPIGIWIRTFERCDENDEDRWENVTWDMETPADSHVSIIARSASELSAILTAPEVTIASIGPDEDTGSRSIEDAFETAGVPLGKYLEITVIMEPGIIETVSPVFKFLQVTYFCSSLG
ncbi:MAG: hypothetical protein ABIJ56_01665 [Pseudomonadota bacterium]